MSADRLALAASLRVSITSSMQTFMTAAAFLAALSAVVLVELPDESKCEDLPYPEWAEYQGVFSWLGLSMLVTDLFAAMLVVIDIDGVPDDLLLDHAYCSTWLHNMPVHLLVLGITFNTLAFIIDSGLRHGCRHLHLNGAISAGCYVLVFGSFCYMRHRRKALRHDARYQHVGHAWLATYADRLPEKEREFVITTIVSRTRARLGRSLRKGKSQAAPVVIEAGPSTHHLDRGHEHGSVSELTSMTAMRSNAQL